MGTLQHQQAAVEETPARQQIQRNLCGNTPSRSHLSVVVDLCFLLNVGVELWDVRDVTVGLVAVGVPVAVCRGDGTRTGRLSPECREWRRFIQRN